MDFEQALYFSLPLVSRFTLVSRSARNIALAPLGSLSAACYADYDGLSLGIETAQYSYDYYVFLLRLFLSLSYSRDKRTQKPKKKHNLSLSKLLCFYLFLSFLA